MTSDTKKRIIDGIIAREGGYINDPSDSGGETNFGITAQVARNFGFHGPMKDLPRDVAFDIYSVLYWDFLKLDFVEQRSPAIADEIADTGVNMGTDRAAKFFQRVLNAFNHGEQYGPDLKVDGKVGPVTVGRLYKLFDHRGDERGEKLVLKALNCLQGAFYIQLTERRVKDRKFLVGWLENRVQ